MKEFNKSETFDLLIKKIRASAQEKDLSESTVKGLTEFVECFFNQESIDSNLAQNIGQFFHYYAQIDEVLTRIIKSLLPELDLSIMGIESSLDKNSYMKKVELIKSLTPNSDKLKIFPLLKKLNTVRNLLAHISPNKVDFAKINHDLTSVFKEAFTVDNELTQRITKEASPDNIQIPLKVIHITKMYLELFANIETLGKKEDKHLRLFEALRCFSSLYVRRRFSILAFQIQTQKNSSEAPEDFKRLKEFDNSLEELNLAVKGFLFEE